jgi:hypothetical protein
MTLYLGHTTSQRILERPGIERLPRSDLSRLEHCLAGRKDLAELDLSLLNNLPRPLDVLVSSRDQVRSWSGVRCHCCPEHLPAGAFIELTSDIYVASPELLYVLRSRELSLPQAIDFGCWLCGTFCYGDNGEILERPQVTTPNRLRSFVELCSHVAGIRNARRAVDWVIPKAASPMEAACAIPFYLSRRLGGFGLPIPELNYRVDLTPAEAEIAGKERIYIDVYWRDFGFGLEYQGEEVHGSYDALRSDIARQLAAEEHHIDFQMMTIDQLREKSQRLAVAKKAARHLGVVLDLNEGFIRRNQAMVDKLLDGCR